MSFHIMCSVLEGDYITTRKIVHQAINTGPHSCALFLAGVIGCVEMLHSHLTKNNIKNQNLVKDWIQLLKEQNI